MSLTDFLLARIAEDEAAWTEAFTSESDAARADEGRPFVLPPLVMRLPDECEARRRIVDEHPPDEDGYCYDSASHLRGCKWLWPCPTLRALALPYVDHPDYRDEWRP